MPVNYNGIVYPAADAHAHIYPEKIAEKATASVGAFYNLKMENTGLPEVLLREGQQGEALAYFEELRERVLPQTAYIDCGNRTVSAILNLETAKARAQGISLDYRCVVEPSLSVRDSDLCALMTNLIDNALEAMVRQRKTDGAVEVGLRQKGSSLYLCVVNPVDGTLSLEELLSLRTTKEDDALHGYGHKIVEGIAARYDGAVNREVQGGRYIVDVVLDMTCAERGEGR